MTRRLRLTINEVSEIWDRIGATEGFLALPIPHPLSFQLGRDHWGNRCFAIVDLNEEFHLEPSKSISVACERDPNNNWMLLFILEDKNLSEIFTKFCWDLIECSRAVDDPVSAVLRQYKKWRRMFAKWSGEVMSDQAQKGLLGELMYLRELMDTVGAEAAVEAWQGPDGGDQDFEFEVGWTEVKTVKISAVEVTISSLQQLDRNDQGFLVVYFADKDGSRSDDSRSVKDLVIDIMDVIGNSTSRDLFQCKLARIGYFDGDIEFSKYRVSNKVQFFVGDDFPRVSRETIPSEIVAAQYVISLPSIQRFETGGC